MEPHTYDKTQIEDQHRAIAAEIADLGRLTAEPDGSAPRILTKLCSVTRSIVLHFRHEEAIMRNMRYRKYCGHKCDHDFIVKILGNVISVTSAGLLPPSNDIALQIANCLIVHQRNHDDDLLEALSHSVWSFDPPRSTKTANSSSGHQGFTLDPPEAEGV